MNAEERFWSKVDFLSDPHGCWLWTGALNGHGYGHGYANKVHFCAHRRAYEETVGPIPDGLHLDHLCRTTRCVNPAHLEPVTSRENALRGISIFAQQARKTHCKRGHEFTEDNTYVTTSGERVCRTCRRAYWKTPKMMAYAREHQRNLRARRKAQAA